MRPWAAKPYAAIPLRKRPVFNCQTSHWPLGQGSSRSAPYFDRLPENHVSRRSNAARTQSLKCQHVAVLPTASECALDVIALWRIAIGIAPYQSIIHDDDRRLVRAQSVRREGCANCKQERHRLLGPGSGIRPKTWTDEHWLIRKLQSPLAPLTE
ncbi:uncharacterized protein B0I36DRAFT_125499 [Microdochium trichocladiopsis]|uniref:Uncharacterized protein n=1 Tax=Microdochium trichocladiopsis TaxID=1682393 RepID=A0A9P9BNW6_9PEZI|nr:uncharacterized protein B0I36DRAFT_125499 [Microdochium trichocladiopsis]KAH7031666.1 hypothetical protein B0I36DRAFT_125499 [Microdochium trichocladiopsis]